MEADEEAATLRGIRLGLEAATTKIDANRDALWPEGVSFVQDAKRHGAIQASAWVANLDPEAIAKEATDAAE